MPKNYYIILGIPFDSSQADIKAAYRRLAKEFHPDYYGKNQAPFQVIHEAYSILSNPQSRKSYDKNLRQERSSKRQASAEPLRSFSSVEAEPLVPGDTTTTQSEITSIDRSKYQRRSVFDDFFDHMLGSFEERRQQTDYQLNNVTVEICLTPSQARSGGNARVYLPMQMACPSCYGHWRSIYHTCWRCNGKGHLQGEKGVVIGYPPGVNENHRVKLRISSPSGQSIYLTAVFTIRPG